MNAVADTSPLCYLVLIDEINLLPKLFDQVLAPARVIAELLHEDAPDPVRCWAASLPPWLSVRENPSRNPAGMEKFRSRRAVLRRIAGCGSPAFWAEPRREAWLIWRPRLIGSGRPGFVARPRH